MSTKDEPTQPTSKFSSALSFVPAIIGLLWFLTVVPSYLLHHPYYTQSFSQFQYWGLLIGLSALLGGGYWFFIKSKLKFRTPSGWKLYALLVLVMNCIIGWYASANNLFTDNPVRHLVYFTGFIILIHLAVLYITCLGYTVGELLLQAFSKRFSGGTLSVIAIALGWSVIGFVLLLLGLIGILHPIAVWIISLAITGLRYRSIGRFLHTLLLRPLPIKNIKASGYLSIALLLIFIGVNMIGATKAFPAGFDGTGLYLNITKLIGEYQALPQGQQAYNWSLFMSIGNLLFGSMTIAILLSGLMSIYCVFAIYFLARLFVSTSNALLACALFYTLPAVTFHSYFDEKIDLGLLYISLSTILLVFTYYFKRKSSKKKQASADSIRIGRFEILPELFLWILVGWLSGFAFGIKYSAVFNILALLGLVLYRKGGVVAFMGSLFTGLSLVFIFGIHRFTGLQLGETSPVVLGAGLLIPGIVLIGWAFRSAVQKLIQTATLIGVFTIVIVVNYSPWIVKHVSENKAVNLSALLNGKSPEPTIRIKPRFRKAKDDAANAANTQDLTLAEIGEQAQREELQRYLGFEPGLPLYLSVPYDVTMNTNIPNRSYLDIGFLWLLILPLLLLAVKPRQLWKNLIWGAVMSFMFLCSIMAVFFHSTLQPSPQSYLVQHAPAFQKGPLGAWQSVMEGFVSLSESIRPIYNWIAQFGLVECIIASLLLFLFVFWLAFGRREAWGSSLKTLLAFMAVYIFNWFLLGSAIPWYGFVALAVLPILLVYYIQHPALLFGEQQKRFATGFLSTSLGLCMILNLFIHFYDAGRRDNQQWIFQRPFLQFATESRSYDDVLSSFNIVYPDALRYLNQNTDDRIYRVGTFLNYQIKENDRRVLPDNQLAEFTRITSKLSDPNYFISVLKDQGFHYILFDLNTATLDQTPEKSLTRKSEEFARAILNPSLTRLLVTDRIIEDPNGPIQIPNQPLRGSHGLSGNILYQGSFILVEIL